MAMQQAPTLEPGRWWQVRDAADGLMLESSNERECRLLASRTPGATLHRLYVAEIGEWRQVPKRRVGRRG